MPKRRRPGRIPTPAWEGARAGPLLRIRRQLGPRAYLLGGLLALVLVAAAIIAFAFVGDYIEERGRPGSAAISVEDRTYNLDYFARRLALLPLTVNVDPAVFVGIVTDQIIEEETVRRFASELGLSLAPEEVEAELATRLGLEGDDPNFAATYQAELDRTGFSDEEYRQMVEAQVLAPKVGQELTAGIPAEVEQVHYRQIQVSTEEEAQAVLARLEAGEDFAAVAREVSTDAQTRDEGGDRGWLARGEGDPFLEDALFLLEPGAISDPLPTQTGVFLFQVVEKALRSLDDSQRQQLERQSYRRWLEEKQQTLTIVNYVAQDGEKLRWAIDKAYGG